jgi:3-oxoacyl-[acyl-carrier-protein] synthase-3
VVTNAELAPRLGVAPEWIEANSGIRERRWVAEVECASDLGAAAVKSALALSGVNAQSVDYLIGCTMSPDYQLPGVAAIVQRKVEGMKAIPAVDLRVGCAAILYALQLGSALINSRSARVVVCFGTEAQSKGLDLHNRSAEISMLFGDGAAALVLSGEPLPAAGCNVWLEPYDFVIGTDGSFADELAVRAPGTANGAEWISTAQMELGLHRGAMNGRVVILQAVRKLVEAARAIMSRNGVSADEISLVVPHQANANLLRSLSGQLKIPAERIVINLDRLGNTSSASAFIALWQAHRDRLIEPGRHILILAFGAGFTWGAALCRAV